MELLSIHLFLQISHLSDTGGSSHKYYGKLTNSAPWRLCEKLQCVCILVTWFNPWQPCGLEYHYPHSTDEKMKAQKNEATYTSSQGWNARLVFLFLKTRYFPLLLPMSWLEATPSPTPTISATSSSCPCLQPCPNPYVTNLTLPCSAQICKWFLITNR